MRQTALAFEGSNRFDALSFTAHFVMRAHPEKLTKWAEKTPGEVLALADCAVGRD
jgi:hypothetical protein